MPSRRERRSSTSGRRSAIHGALAFGLGGLIEIVSFVYPTLLPRSFLMKHPWSMKYPGTTIISLAGPVLGGAIGGAWLGWVMKKRAVWAVEGALAFGVGFLPAAIAMLITLMAGQGMSGNESILETAPFFTLGFGIGFGISGALAGALVLAGSRVLLASAKAFAIGGVAGGIVISTAFLLLRLLGHSQGQVLTYGMFAGILVPYCLGGALLGAAVPGLPKSEENGPVQLGL